jgi:hypothetical protein|tara:strand:- start:43 stop:423 length:381 start_codon:yes stop_codon:yes gene_type:complete
MSETKQPDWDKITEGKIRHGFAVAAFTNGMNMTDELCTQIECWVRYVVDGKSVSGNGEVSNSAFDKAENNTDEEYIAEIIRDKAQALTSGDRDNVLKSLADGHITKKNLDVCLRRIEELTSNNAEL